MTIGQLDRRLLAVMMADVVVYSRQMEGGRGRNDYTGSPRLVPR